MVGQVDLRNWKKQKEILDELYKYFNINISSREWRKAVEEWNKKWAEGEVDYCVIQSSAKGFKATNDLKEAYIAINDFRSRIRKMHARQKAILQGFKAKNNYKLDFEKGELK